ncbi:putative DNA helicase [Xenohaliotis phage pCXc-HC2016]|nr:putative DNA helicase [Xenohaliotis phage pCXc-HC2016]AQW89110.1 putative DNA helicase [Xenohaliotis phage pCXc-HR2015]
MVFGDENEEYLQEDVPDLEQKIPEDFDFCYEEEILGRIISNNDVLDEISGQLRPEHFFVIRHSKLYQALLTIRDSGQPLTIPAIEFFLSGEKLVEDVGTYIRKLKNYSNGLDPRHIAKTIKDYCTIRETKKILTEAQISVANEGFFFKITDHVKRLEQKLSKLLHTSEENAKPIKSIVKSTLKYIEQAMKNDSPITGIPTGFNDVDFILDGLNKTDLIIIAARPSMGKTALAVNMMLNIAKKNIPTLFMSLEMTGVQLIMRMLSMETSFSAVRIKRGNLTEEEFSKVSATADFISSLPIVIDDCQALSIYSLAARIRQIKKHNNIECVFVDYLQLISARHSVKVYEIAEITKALKCLAKELNIPIVLLCQLSRTLEARDDKKPKLADLRDSGSIEQDADVVIFLYREAYYLERLKPEEGTTKYLEWQERMLKIYKKANLIIAKHRNGAIGEKNLTFNPRTTTFSNYINQEE